MKRSLLVILFSLLLMATVFAKQPKLKEAFIVPQVVTPGDSVTVTVLFTGKHKDIKQVYLTVRQSPENTPDLTLLPEKNNKKKNVWILKTIVPWDAPHETLNLDITAIDKKGREIVSKGLRNQTTGKAGSVTIIIN